MIYEEKLNLTDEEIEFIISDIYKVEKIQIDLKQSILKDFERFIRIERSREINKFFFLKIHHSLFIEYEVPPSVYEFSEIKITHKTN